MCGESSSLVKHGHLLLEGPLEFVFLLLCTTKQQVEEILSISWETHTPEGVPTPEGVSSAFVSVH